MDDNTFPIRERLISYIESKGLKRAEFHRMAGLQKNFINNLRSAVRADTINKIVGAFPDLSVEWLITGNGQMLKEQKSETTSNSQNQATQPAQAADIPTPADKDLQKDLKSAQKEIDMLNALLAEVRYSRDELKKANAKLEEANAELKAERDDLRARLDAMYGASAATGGSLNSRSA